MKMKRFITVTAALAAAAAVLASCLKDENIVAYNYTTIGSISGSVFHGDGGETIDIVEKEFSSALEDEERVVAVFDVLERLSDVENHFTGRLKSYTLPLVKNSIHRSSVTEPLGSDPIGFRQPWISGGYLNLVFSYPYRPSSEVKHEINLVVEKESAARDTLYLTICHDAGGETLESGIPSLQLGSGYASFVVDELKEHSYKALTFEWNWYETDTYGNPFTNEPRHYKESLMLE